MSDFAKCESCGTKLLPARDSVSGSAQCSDCRARLQVGDVRRGVENVAGSDFTFGLSVADHNFTPGIHGARTETTYGDNALARRFHDSVNSVCVCCLFVALVYGSSCLLTLAVGKLNVVDLFDGAILNLLLPADWKSNVDAQIYNSLVNGILTAAWLMCAMLCSRKPILATYFISGMCMFSGFYSFSSGNWIGGIFYMILLPIVLNATIKGRQLQRRGISLNRTRLASPGRRSTEDGPVFPTASQR